MKRIVIVLVAAGFLVSCAPTPIAVGDDLIGCAAISRAAIDRAAISRAAIDRGDGQSRGSRATDDRSR